MQAALLCWKVAAAAPRLAADIEKTILMLRLSGMLLSWLPSMLKGCSTQSHPGAELPSMLLVLAAFQAGR